MRYAQCTRVAFVVQIRCTLVTNKYTNASTNKTVRLSVAYLRTKMHAHDRYLLVQYEYSKDNASGEAHPDRVEGFS